MRPLSLVQAAAFPFPSPQGSQVYVAGMARALARRGHRVIVACYGHGLGQPPPELELLRTPRIPGYRRTRAGPDLAKPVLDLALALRLAGLGRGVDLVHAHNYEAPLAAALARGLTGVPFVYNNHNTMSEELHRYFRGRPARCAARLAGEVLDRTVPRLADATVAISEQSVPILRRLGCRRIRCIPPGVDPADLQGARPERARAALGMEGRCWVVYAGNPDPYQDLGVLLRAFARLDELGLLMVSSSSLVEWERMARPIPAARKRFVVTRSWPETRELLAAADLAALPRARCSGYPIKLLNYLGLGLPVVCAEGSARDLPGVVAVPGDDPVAFAAALRELARDPKQRAKLGARAREHVLAHCTWDARAAELEELYLELLRD